jgi:hypothetical protein
MISQACLMAMHNECKYVQAHPESAAKMLYHRTAYGTFLSEAFAEKVRVEYRIIRDRENSHARGQ